VADRVLLADGEDSLLVEEVLSEADGYATAARDHDWQDGTGARRPLLGRPAALVVDEVRALNATRLATGHTRWSAVVLELLAEATATEDRTDLRRCVVHLAAAAVAWADSIDRRDT
jgi:hypothetical protein